MNHKAKYPPGSPKDILVRLRRTAREIEQMIRDIQYVNDNNPNFRDKPIDIGTYLVRLKKTRDVIEQVRGLVASGCTNLPDGILAPLCEPW